MPQSKSTRATYIRVRQGIAAKAGVAASGSAVGLAACLSCLIALALAALASAAAAWALAWLWDQAMPALFHLPSVTGLQVLLLMAILCLAVGFVKTLFPAGASR